MNPNDAFKRMHQQQEQMRQQQEQMRKQQQEQMHRQQEQLRRQQEMAWVTEQERKRKRHQREAQMQGGGVNISGSQLDLGGDIVGRDKVHQVSASYPRDEKSGCALFIERGFTFVVGFIGGAIFWGVLGGFVLMLLGGSEDLLPLLIIGVLIGALGTAITAATQVSRYRD